MPPSLVLTLLSTLHTQVSEKIVLLDDEARKLKAREADLDARAEQLLADKTTLLAAQEELRAEVADKVTLLDEFEARFQRQYKWVTFKSRVLLCW